MVLEKDKVTSALAASGRYFLESVSNSIFGAPFYASPLLMRLIAAGAVHIGKNPSDGDSPSSQGTTIIHIENVTINITADVVHQLNMNPQEVINQLTEQIQQTSFKAIDGRRLLHTRQ